MLALLYEFFSRRFRPGRLRLLYRLVGIDATTRVLDVGGTLSFWSLAPQRSMPLPKVTIVNLSLPGKELPEGFTWVVADGKWLPFRGKSFDVVVSNSVIEHLGQWDSQVQFASELRRVAKKHFVQTPHPRFPIELHYMTPFIHWLPEKIRKYLIRNFTLWGILARPTPEQCKRMLAELRLLTPSEAQMLFPQSEILVETFLFLPKSLLVFSRKQ